MIKDYDIFFGAVTEFVYAHCNFESTQPLETAMSEIGNCDSLQEVFSIPLQHRLFNIDAALRWVLFMTIAPARALADGDPPFNGDPFSEHDAVVLISQVYDIGVQETVLAHFANEEDGEEEEDEEDEK